jgi:tRNA splicing endonuclease
MAELKNGKVTVSKEFGEIVEQGFGEMRGKALELASFEALYLLEKKKIEVTKGGKTLGVKELAGEFRKREKAVLKVYAVFRDLRIAGHVARDGKCATPCLRVYSRGVRPGEEPARYLVWIVGWRRFSLGEFEAMISRAHAVRKRPVFAAVRKGTITYFKIDTTKF